jgi:hypothetical protein
MGSQESLGSIRGLIEDATKDTIVWLQDDPSAEERVHVLAIQTGLVDLARIVERRMERRSLPNDGQQWSKTVTEVLSRLDEARDVRGHIVGKGLARLADHLPRELPGPKVPLVTQAPAPPKEMGGLGLAPYRPKPTEVPDLPLYYPNDLKLQTQLILVEAVRKFLDRARTGELCEYVISELTPHFRAAVLLGTLRADQALSESGGMGALLHSVLVYNDPGTPSSGFSSLSNEAYRLEREVKKSDEWLRLAKAILEAENQRTKQMESSHARKNDRTAQSAESKSMNAAVGRREVPASTKRSRLTATINCPSAASRMEAYLESKAISQTDFASSVNTTDRTLRAFRKTGRVRRDIFDAIAKAMNITKEELLKPE